MGIYDLVIHKFHEGGLFVMSSITFVLIFAFLISFERFVRYWFTYDLGNSEAFMSAIQKMVMSNSIENAVRMCKQASPKLLPYVIGEGLKRANETTEEIEHALDCATLTALPKINHWINFLATIANIATLMGLLGTIFGLIRSFGGAANATGADKQKILAEGIAEALTATSFGLTTALLCILVHGILSLKKDSLTNEIHEYSAKIFDILSTRKLKQEAG